jgi:hypothetical protein
MAAQETPEGYELSRFILILVGSGISGILLVDASDRLPKRQRELLGLFTREMLVAPVVRPSAAEHGVPSEGGGPPGVPKSQGPAFTSAREI